MPYLLRHAHAGDQRAWAGPESERPLSSPTVWCLQTVEPLAQRRSLRVESADAGVDADPTDLVAPLLDRAAAHGVLGSDGEPIGAARTRLVGERSEDDSLSWPKGSTWVLEVTEGHVQAARHLPPLRLQGP